MDNRTDLISIVMPVKNAEMYLYECLQSICAQTEENWELITVNDHSEDDSYTILQEFASKESRIKPYQNKGEGIIPALQLAYSKCSGNFIHRMDADDIMPPIKLNCLKQLLIDNGTGYVATGKVNYFAEDTLSDGFLNYEQWLNTMCDQNSHWNEIYKECVIPSPCWMTYRTDFEKCGAFESEVYPEDYDLVFRFYANKLKVVASNEVLHKWRDHSERASRNLEHYRENGFFKLKVDAFLKLDYDKTRPLILWGAGKKGKIMAKLLDKKKVPFEWVSNNPNKHGKEIYNQLMASFESILQKDNPQVIVNVAQKKAKAEISKFLDSLNLIESDDYWYFS